MRMLVSMQDPGHRLLSVLFPLASFFFFFTACAFVYSVLLIYTHCIIHYICNAMMAKIRAIVCVCVFESLYHQV